MLVFYRLITAGPRQVPWPVDGREIGFSNRTRSPAIVGTSDLGLRSQRVEGKMSTPNL